MSFLNPLSKAGYVLYCMGEAWFNARKYNADNAHYQREQSVIQEGITRILTANEKQFSSRLQTQQLDANAFQQQQTIRGFFNRLGQNVLLNTQRVLQVLNRQVFAPFIIQPFTTILQNTQRFIHFLSRFAAVILQGAGSKSVDENLKADETERNHKAETGDKAQYADLFVRRSQASGQSGST